MNKRQLIGLIFLLLPLVAFQCARWANYARDIEANVTPEIISLSSDTIAFKIHIEPGAYWTGKNERVVLMLYAMTEGNNELIFRIEDTSESPISRQVLAALKTNREVKSLGLRMQKYRRDKLKVNSPILPIAEVRDLR